MRRLKKEIDPEAFKARVIFHKGLLKPIAQDFGVSMAKVSQLINVYFKYSEIEALRNTRMDRQR